MEKEYTALRKHIEELLKKNIRIDGRKKDEIREIKIETDYISAANGSARIRIGETEVIVGVKLDVGEPFPDSGEEGTLIVSAEMTPIADYEFEPGPPREDAIELSRVVDRAIRESKFLDTKKLCIKKDEKVWMVFIDAVILNNDGNLFDACQLGAVTALRTALFPKYDKKEDKVNHKEKTKNKIALNDKVTPIMTTFAKIGNEIILDPTKEEETVADAEMHIAIANGEICAIQKSKEGFFKEEEIYNIIDSAIKLEKEKLKIIKKN